LEAEVIYKHALRNALLPVVTILGLSVPSLIGGSVIFEQIFVNRHGISFFGLSALGFYASIDLSLCSRSPPCSFSV